MVGIGGDVRRPIMNNLLARSNVCLHYKVVTHINYYPDQCAMLYSQLK